MAKPKKKTVRTFAIIGGALIVVQGAVLFFFRGDAPVDIKDAIEKAVDNRNDIDATRKAQVKIQLALGDYRASHGEYPKSLDQLIPDYFNAIPGDPSTGKPFPYKVENGKYSLGPETSTMPSVVAVAGSTNSNQAIDASTLTDDQRIALVASLEKSEEKPFVYDPSGKRDPFRQFDFAPKTDNSTAKTELEKYSIGQLKVTAILDGFTEPMAMVENEAGRGFRIKKGVKIGTNNGEVIEVQKDRILVLETNVDFTGESKTRTIEMRLRTKDQEEKVFPAPR